MASQVTQLVSQMKHGRPVLFEPGDQVRDFVYVDDVAAAFIKSAEYALSGHSKVLNCGSGVGVSFNGLVRAINPLLGTNCEPNYVAQPKNYLSNVVLDVDETKLILDWAPRSIHDGLRSYLTVGLS
jgi:nucleoside-diphosphate-sugar epimerase